MNTIKQFLYYLLAYLKKMAYDKKYDNWAGDVDNSIVSLCRRHGSFDKIPKEDLRATFDRLYFEGRDMGINDADILIFLNTNNFAWTPPNEGYNQYK